MTQEIAPDSAGSASASVAETNLPATAAAAHLELGTSAATTST